MDDNDIILDGVLDSPYYQDKDAKKAIDEALEQCAILRTKVGTRQLKDENGKWIDDRGSDEAMLWVKTQENKILGGVMDLDYEFVEPLLYPESTFDKE